MSNVDFFHSLENVRHAHYVVSLPSLYSSDTILIMSSAVGVDSSVLLVVSSVALDVVLRRDLLGLACVSVGVQLVSLLISRDTCIRAQNLITYVQQCCILYCHF